MAGVKRPDAVVGRGPLDSASGTLILPKDPHQQFCQDQEIITSEDDQTTAPGSSELRRSSMTTSGLCRLRRSSRTTSGSSGLRRSSRTTSGSSELRHSSMYQHTKRPSSTGMLDRCIPNTPGTSGTNDEPMGSIGSPLQVSSSKRLPFSFYDQACETLAHRLLGNKLVHRLDSGEELSGVIVETEAYLGGEDRASHSYNGKRTGRNEAMYMDPGTAYVYHIYGIYTCINISSRGEGAAVLVRALDPLRGQGTMKVLRGAKRSDGGRNLKDHELCNGPSKLTQALGVNKQEINKQNLVTSTQIWLEVNDHYEGGQIVKSTRIGVDYAGEWAQKPLRFYVLGNRNVSARDKAAETRITENCQSQRGTQSNRKRKMKEKYSPDPQPSTASKLAPGKDSMPGQSSIYFNDDSMTTTKPKGKGKAFAFISTIDSGSKSTTTTGTGSDDTDQSEPHFTGQAVSPESPYDGPDQYQTSSLVPKGASLIDPCSPLRCVSGQRLGAAFYNQPGLKMARDLLGQTIVCIDENGHRLSGRIVETEAYLGHEDPCCHSYRKTPTNKTKAMFMDPGTAYVYTVYYSYCCFNISCQGDGSVVLLRAFEPLEGLEEMRARRLKNLKEGSVIKDHEIANGPSKICLAMGFSKDNTNEMDLVQSRTVWLEEAGGLQEEEGEGVLQCARTGLGKGLPQEWRDKPWRFYIRGNRCVSVRDREAEALV